jgi:hypothetical protein
MDPSQRIKTFVPFVSFVVKFLLWLKVRIPCYNINMTTTIRKIVDIPADKHLSIDLPESVPAGKTNILLMLSTPENAEAEPSAPLEEAQKIWNYNRSHSAEIRTKLQKLRGALPFASFGGMDGVRQFFETNCV